MHCTTRKDRSHPNNLPSANHLAVKIKIGLLLKETEADEVILSLKTSLMKGFSIAMS